MRALYLVCLAACGDGASSSTPDAAASGDAATSACTPASGWLTAPPVGTGPTQETATVALDGKLYVLGGFDETNAVLDLVQVFDIATCTWSLGPALPRPVHHTNAAVHDGSIYVVGAMEGGNFASVGHVWRWAPGDAAWTVLPSMPAGTERGASFTATVGERIYVIGGLRNGSIAQSSAYVVGTQTWEDVPQLPQSRDHGCGGVVGDTLYVTGGRAAAVQGQVWALVGGQWEARAAMPTPRGGTACGVVGERIVVVGGEWNAAAASGVFPEVESYSPATDSWEQHGPMPTPRHGMGAAGWDGSLYVPGGATTQGFGAVDTFEVLTL